VLTVLTLVGAWALVRHRPALPTDNAAYGESPGLSPTRATRAGPATPATGRAAPAGSGPSWPEAHPASSASRTATGTHSAPSGASLRGCPNLPAGDIWHADVSRLPVAARSARYLASIGADRRLHPDFGSGTWEGGPIGIPVTYVGGGQRRVPVSFDHADESDPGPYPIPGAALVEGGPTSDGDRHVLVVDTAACRLYEMFDAHPNADGSWHAGSGAVYDLRSDRLRPAGWTSADAAGLPIVPGLVRYEEVAAGRIDHAVRITVPLTRKRYLWPARHAASASHNPALPPMGLRLRLKAGVDISRLPEQARIVAQAMKTYGVIVADNGSPWFLGGAPDPRWDNDALAGLGRLTGGDFEAVDVTDLMTDPNSGRTG